MNCPLCDEPFPDESALRSHLGEAHALFDEEGAPAPVNEPEPEPEPEPAIPPGWYADPWGTSPFRYWDGAQWTGHTSGPQGPGELASPHTPSRRGVPTPVVIALVVSIVLFFGVLAFVINRHRGSSPVAVPEAPSSSGQGAASTPNDATLMGLLLQPSDLPGGFTILQAPTVLKDSPATPGCDSPFAANPNIVEVATSYTYEPQANGTEHGHVISYATASPSASVEQAQREWRAGPGLDCIKQSEEQNLSDSFQRGSGASIISASASMANPSLPLSGDEQVVTIQYRYSGGQATATTEVYHLYNGRYEVTLLTNHCSCPGVTFPDAQIVSGGISALSSRLSALPNP